MDQREREVPRSVLASCCVCVRGNQSRVFLSQGDPGPEGRVGYDGVPGNAVRKKDIYLNNTGILLLHPHSPGPPR